MNTPTAAQNINALTPDDLNDIARAAVNSVYGERPPSELTHDERAEWQASADRFFFAACDSLAGITDAQTARDRALSAVREAAGE